MAKRNLVLEAGLRTTPAASEVTSQKRKSAGQLKVHNDMIASIHKDLAGMPQETRMKALETAATFHPAGIHLGS